MWVGAWPLFSWRFSLVVSDIGGELVLSRRAWCNFAGKMADDEHSNQGKSKRIVPNAPMITRVHDWLHRNYDGVARGGFWRGLAGTPTTVVSDGTSLVTTAPAPVRPPSAMVRGATIIEPEPMKT